LGFLAVTGDDLHQGLAAAQRGEASGRLPLHQGLQRLAEQLAAFPHTGELMGSGQQVVVEGDGGAHEGDGSHGLQGSA
jgi:hypothetical protein